MAQEQLKIGFSDTEEAKPEPIERSISKSPEFEIYQNLYQKRELALYAKTLALESKLSYGYEDSAQAEARAINDKFGKGIAKVTIKNDGTFFLSINAPYADEFKKIMRADGTLMSFEEFEKSFTTQKEKIA